MIRTFFENATNLKVENVSRILLFFDVEKFIIGDTCDRLARIKVCHEVFPAAKIDLCCNHNGFAHLVKHNQYLTGFWVTANWNNIEFLNYDLVICVSYREEQLYDYLVSRYSEAIKTGTFRLAVVGARSLYDTLTNITFVFPSFHDSFNTGHISGKSLRNEIFVSEEERDWGKQWLMERGVTDQDRLIILIDNSNARSKLLSLNVHFSLVKFFLQIPRSKILVFDENGMGKKKFYGAWLGSENIARRFVFAERTTLRESMSLIAAPFVKFIFGPCTGILHCAAGIYNVLSKRHGHDFAIPPMLVYRGIQGEDNPYRWWGNSLASCVLIKRNDEGKLYAKLLDDDDRNVNVALKNLCAASEFSSDILVNFMTEFYGESVFQNVSVK